MSDPNDLQAFLDEAWQHLARGVADSKSPARYPTFATVSADGIPQARTVALRGASQSEESLEVHTDISTAKVADLKHAPIAAFHIWLPRADLQIRLTTSVEILTGPDVTSQWEKIPAASRVSYGTQPVPGVPIADVYAYEKPAERSRFAVLKCKVTDIDLVHLGARHRRAGYRAATNWAGTWLAP
jgi:pyridoxine/pyridoxamine 5'-phosphate oxidase